MMRKKMVAAVPVFALVVSLAAPLRADDFWDITIVDALANAGNTASLAILPSGHPAISYNEGRPNYGLKYAWYDGNTWHRTAVDSAQGVGTYNSLAILPSGTAPAVS